MAPDYLIDRLNVRQIPHLTRSTNSTTLTVPYVSKNSHAKRAFSVVGPRTWNKLPGNIRNIDSLEVFKKKP